MLPGHCHRSRNVLASSLARGVPDPGTGPRGRRTGTEMRISRSIAALAGAAALLCGRDESSDLPSSTAPQTRPADSQTSAGCELRLDDEWFDFCTGTLVAPNVVLTAAHCTAFFTGEVGDEDKLGPDDWRISFDADPGDDSTYYGADHFVDLHPTAGQRGRTGRRQLEDVIPRAGPGGHRAGLSHRGGGRRDPRAGRRRRLPRRTRPDRRDLHGSRLRNRRVHHRQCRLTEGDHGVRRGAQLQGRLGDHQAGPVPRPVREDHGQRVLR